MELQFWGAARTVTGSMHLLRVGGRQILLDCGMYQGRRKRAFEINRDLPFAASEIDAVVLSHAHIDHSGNLPTLVRAGFRGGIYATSATRDLCAPMLLDAAHIQESDVAFVNRRRARQGKRPFEPLYMRGDAMAALRHFRSVEYGQTFEPAPGVQVHFLDAGHILGSAVVVIDVEEGGRRVRIVFSGDLGRRGLPILRDPEAPAGADVLIMESTYGNRTHPPAQEARGMLLECVRSTCDRGGMLLIPAFAVGRTQEVVYALNQLWESGDLPQIDVFVDSPLAVNVTEVFRLHPECFNDEMLDAMMTESDRDPLGFARLRYVRAAERSRELNTRTEPAVIIAASGMCEAGRILHHLKNHLGDDRTTVLFVGYQAEHTLGRRILEGQSPVSIFGEQVPVRARIDRGEGYSAHADRPGLLAWEARVRAGGAPRRTFLVHGEEDGMRALADGLREQGASDVQAPERGEVFVI